MKNERLIANAGSGKTHALTTRMIQLLAQDVEPRKIAALTFTRKSAGEFLSAVFMRLAEAAMDVDKLADLRRSLPEQNIDEERCRMILAKLALQLGRLGMGTIDSLFARIARAFPLESGLAEDFAMAGEAEIQFARERTLAALFATESTASLADFIDLLRRINRNHGERDVFKKLLGETKELHGKFLATPSDTVWGDASSIWNPAGCEILSAGDPAPAAQRLWEAIQNEHPDLKDDAFQVWQEGLLLAARHPYPKPFSEDLKKVFKKLSQEKTTPEGVAYIATGNAHAARVILSPSIRALRDELRNSMLKPEFESLLQRSKSLHALMKKFEEFYDAHVRSAGLVTFGDITDSLAKRACDVDWNSSVGYRIDQKFEHWLLDEFQDTSRPQWKILKTFIDEVVMDPEANRSFFYVGDTKQAIYSWRGGDPDLFFEIFDQYNEHSPVIQEAAPLDQSWRSCQPILDFVNKVFGDLAHLKDTLEIPDSITEKWRMAWAEHTTSPKTRKAPGYAEWVSVPKNDGFDDDEEADPQELKVLAILEETRAWERGFSCAVLKRDNKGVESLAALLQSRGIPVAIEGKTNPCVDNPLGAAIIAALRLCASPDDALAAAIVGGFQAAAAWGLQVPWSFRNQTLARLAQAGFSGTIRQWIEATGLQAEPFLQERAAEFLLAAEEFDACRKSSHGIHDFVRFIENRQTQENEASGVVRIMTVHQSKGLGFDMVIASGLDKRSGGNDGPKLTLGPSATLVKWGVLLPAKDIAEHDEVLRNQIKIDEAEKKYGEICTAYVALTRAKKALYVVTTELGKDTKAKNFARHLALSFGDASAQFGDPAWYEENDFETNQEAIAARSTSFRAPIHGTPKPTSPSSFKSKNAWGNGNADLSLDAADLGTEVHEALARIEWIDSPVAEISGFSRAAENLVRGFLQKPIAQSAFAKPENPSDLWRERAFEVMLDGQWISGVFDRVVVHRSAQGPTTSAIIYDFKTERGSAAEIEERYAGQMEVYRQAVAKLLDLPIDDVKSQILCVR